MPRPEDTRSNTVADAEAYERWRAQDDVEEEPLDYYPEDDEPDEDEYYDDCGCSDPCCPCEGRKSGTP